MEQGFEIPAVTPQPVFDRSALVGELMDALAKAQGEFEAATKDSANPYYNSKYADLATIIGAARPALAKHGIAFFHTVGADLERQTASATGYLFKGEQYISAYLEVPAVGKVKAKWENGKQVEAATDRFDAQTIGAAQTYCRRYTAAPLLGIAQEDDDGNTIVRDDSRAVPAKQPAENWKAQQANKAKPPSQTPTKLEGNILTATVKEIKSGKTKQGKEYRAVVLEDSIAIPGAPYPFDTVWVWHQSMWDDLAGMPGKECEFMVAQSDKGFTLNSILKIGAVEWTEPETKAEEVQP